MARVSLAAQRARALALADRLADEYPARCGLTHQTPFQLLVATILSAQCTDEAVNKVTPVLFERYPDAEALAQAPPADIEPLINSLGLFRNKAKSLCGAAALLVNEFAGEVPRTMAELVRLPGVARKTANVVLGTAFGIASGMVVDTHVQRLAQRLGLTRQTDPVKIEQDLMKLLPQERWIETGHTIVWHGRQCCTARRPACERCPVSDLCPRIGLP